MPAAERVRFDPLVRRQALRLPVSARRANEGNMQQGQKDGRRINVFVASSKLALRTRSREASERRVFECLVKFYEFLLDFPAPLRRHSSQLGRIEFKYRL